MNKNFLDFQALRDYLTEAVAHYEKSAPQLSEWLDELYVSANHTPRAVSVYELLQLQQLSLNGEWEQPNFAQNRWYKVRELNGQERGVLSF